MSCDYMLHVSESESQKLHARQTQLVQTVHCNTRVRDGCVCAHLPFESFDRQLFEAISIKKINPHTTDHARGRPQLVTV